MLKLAKLTLAIAAAALAVPAMAGNSWPQGPSGNAKAAATGKTPAVARTEARSAPAAGFTYSGEGVGWEPSQHKYVFAGKGLAHSNECDHVMRTASAVTPAMIEEARKQWPGG